jgi:hypothetical protein
MEGEEGSKEKRRQKKKLNKRESRRRKCKMEGRATKAGEKMKQEAEEGGVGRGKK